MALKANAIGHGSAARAGDPIRQDETQQVLVSVTDCGVGISAENADRLFQRLLHYQISGMGMGLSICRSIMEAHGGRLWATANIPHGATFSVHNYQ